MDVVYERCAGIDISKADVKVCIRVPGRGKGTRRRGEVRTFPAMTSGLLAMRDWLLAEIGAAASVGSVADSYDNAMAEALKGTFKAELIEMQGPWTGFDQVERAIFQWVTWYNEERLHSALDYVPPAEYERDRGRRQEVTQQSA